MRCPSHKCPDLNWKYPHRLTVLTAWSLVVGPNKGRLWNLWELGPSWLRVIPGRGLQFLPLLLSLSLSPPPHLPRPLLQPLTFPLPPWLVRKWRAILSHRLPIQRHTAQVQSPNDCGCTFQNSETKQIPSQGFLVKAQEMELRPPRNQSWRTEFGQWVCHLEVRTGTVLT